MNRFALVTFALLGLGAASAPARAQSTQLRYFTGNGRVAAPCFLAGEEVGVEFIVPTNQFPVVLDRVTIGWSSVSAGHDVSNIQALRIYSGGFPAPEDTLLEIPYPTLTDGEDNVFMLPGLIRLDAGTFTVAVEYAADNTGEFYAGSVAHDGDGCHVGTNLVRTLAGGWQDARELGFTGDWAIDAWYTTLNGVVAFGNEDVFDYGEIPLGETHCLPAFISNIGTDTLTVAGFGGNLAPFFVDTMLTNHVLGPGESTTFEICVTSIGGTTKLNHAIRVHSNANNSPTLYSLLYTPPVQPTGVPGISSRELRITGIVPNPFNPETAIHFVLPVPDAVYAEVWSITGARVRTLESGAQYPGGSNIIRWDGRDDGGTPAASGVYFLRVRAGGSQRTARMVLLK